jgi:HK97 family phage portal protein
MSVCDILFHAEEYSISDLVNPKYWLTELYSGVTTASGQSITPYSATSVSAYYAAMRVISEDVAKLPLITYRRVRPRGKERAPSHPYYDLLHLQPHPEIGAMSFRETLTQWAMGWGDGYARIVRDRKGLATRLVPQHPSKVEIRRTDDKGDLYYRVKTKNGEYVDVLDQEMIHIHGMGDDGVKGYSVAQIAAETLGLSKAAEKCGASLFGQGINPRILLKHPATLRDDGRERLKEQWDKLYGDPSEIHRTAVLEEGMSVEKLTIPPEDAQFLETRQFQVEEVARWFRVPPHKIGHLEKSTNNNIEQQSIEYLTDCLLSWLRRWEEELARKLFPGTEYFAEHLVDGLLRGDGESRGKFYREMFYIGSMSPNDIREKENANPVDGGDTYFVPVNMMRLEDVAEGVQAAAPGAPGTSAPTDDEDEEESSPRGPARAPAEPPGGARRGERGPGAEALLAAFRPVLSKSVGRLVRKEEAAIGRAAKRYRPPEGAAALKSWWSDFSSEQLTALREDCQPVLAGYAALDGGAPWSGTHEAALVRHLARAQALLELDTAALDAAMAGYLRDETAITVADLLAAQAAPAGPGA